MRFTRYLAAVALTGVLGGCADALDVTNPNNPDRGRVLRTPADVQSLAASQFQQVISGTVGDLARVNQRLMSLGLENANGLANNAMGPASAIPKLPIDNARGNAYQDDNFNTYRILSFVTRNSADILLRSKSPDFSLGIGREGDVTRLNAWTHFLSAVSHGYLAMTYDSTAIARPDDPLPEIPPLSNYTDVIAYSMAQFDSALTYANRAGMTDIPSGWLTGPGGPSLTPAEFRRVVRSFRARMTAGVARSPAERAAVNWDQVIDDATNGITADLLIHMHPSSSWDHHWTHTSYHYRDPNWHQQTYYIIGMADVSGGFDNWLSQPRATRTYFTIVTPDKRFPEGATRAEQQRAQPTAPLPEGQYFRNRPPGDDIGSTGWIASQYDHYRFRAHANAGRIGPYPWFTKAENDMLAAEGYIRKGNIGAAAALIDVTRTKNGLPGLTGVVTTADQPVPGGSQCVPRVPVGPNYTSTACGNIMEAMKWEKRLETAYTTYGAWYFDGRGWGDLPEGTPIQLPVPVQELDARSRPSYNMGGAGREGGTGPSNYGYGSGDR